ncbi:MAG TPA: killer suppression protein [Lamprocystis sp. (in: g-proteobacteria)]|nr:killer suppression protein [Lamprocystis sp. (in: g-proteobacteria)]
MDIAFRTVKLEKEFREGRRLQAVHGERRARLIMRRMQELRAATSLADLWPPYSGPGRCHELTGDRAGQLSLDLDHPYRLIFKPNHDPRPDRPEGGLDRSRVTSVRIHGVEDTHD